jgi:hypothetical protein
MPQLGREHYGLILSGKDANQVKGLLTLRPSFHNAFFQTKSLSAWAKVGAVPMMRQAMRHLSVRPEVMREDTCILVEDFDPFCIFDYKSATMLDVEHHNKIVFVHLNSMGFNGDSFVFKAHQKAHNLVQRLSKKTSEEERVTALAKSGISLSSIFLLLGLHVSAQTKISRPSNTRRSWNCGRQLARSKKRSKSRRSYMKRGSNRWERKRRKSVIMKTSCAGKWAQRPTIRT